MKIWQLILVYLNKKIRARCHTCVCNNTTYTNKMVIQKQLRKYGDGNIILFAQLSKVFTSNSITQLLKSLDSPFSHSWWTFLVKISIFRLRNEVIFTSEALAVPLCSTTFSSHDVSMPKNAKNLLVYYKYFSVNK